MAGVAGFEPTNDGIKNRCLTTWRHPNHLMDVEYFSIFYKKMQEIFNLSMETGAPGEIRTHDLRLRRATLYPAELQAQHRYIVL